MSMQVTKRGATAGRKVRKKKHLLIYQASTLIPSHLTLTLSVAPRHSCHFTKTCGCSSDEGQLCFQVKNSLCSQQILYNVHVR